MSSVEPTSTQPLHSPSSPSDAIACSLAAIQPVGTERVVQSAARGRVLAEPIRADRDSPAIDVSAMDGYAVAMASLLAGELPVAGEVRIGHAPPMLPAGAALRIVTGAAIPPGADAVVKREDVDERSASIRLSDERRATIRAGDHIRRRGENASAGTEVLVAGSLVTAAAVGALASVGCAAPLVRRALRIAMLSTGDEVLPSDATHLAPWQLRDSNGPALEALFAGYRFLAPIERRHVADDEHAIAAAIAEALREADALILTGGVSMGHRDFVPAALSANGVRTLYHRVPQRPGKPILGAVTDDGRPIFGLPGNPVSVLVTARRIVLPALARRAGLADGVLGGPDALVTVDEPDSKTISLWWHRLVRRIAFDRVRVTDLRGSGDVVGAAAADGFVEIPPGASGTGPWPFFRWMT